MDTFLFIDEDCFLNVAMEASAMRAALLFTDTVTSNGVLANALQMYNGVEKAGDDEILAWVIATKESLPDGEDLVNNYYQIYNYEKKVRAQKHKSKDDLIFLNKLVSSKAHMRDYVKLDMKCKLEEQRAVHLSRFESEKIILCQEMIKEYVRIEREDYVTDLIIEKMINPENMLVIMPDYYPDEKGEKFVEYFKSSSRKSELPAFLHLFLFDFPDMPWLDYEALLYTRKNIHNKLGNFSETLIELKNNLRNIKWSPENKSVIFESVDAARKLLPDNMQEKIHEELHIQQALHQTRVNPGFNISLGISSMDYIIRYFVKTKTVRPLIADNIRHKLRSYSDDQKTIIFFYLQPQFDYLIEKK